MPLKLIQRGKYYYLRGSVRGIHVYESAKTDDAAVAETIRIIRERELLEESIFGKKAVVTFRTACDAYLASGGSSRFLAPLLARMGSKKLRDITQKDLDAAARLLYPETSPETRNRQFFTPFIAVWNHAAKNGWAEVRPWQRPRRPKGTASRREVTRSGSRSVDYERAARFVAAMSPAPAMVMTALFFTGMRPVELFTLRAEDLDIGRRWITLVSTKTGEPRGVPMHEFLVPLLAGLIERGGTLFRTHKGEPYPIYAEGGGGLKTAINGARRRSGINDISPYTARHSVSTQLVVNGVHPHIKDQILGHAADDMSRRYTHVPQLPLIEAINTIAVPNGWPMWENPLAEAGKLVKWRKK